MSKDDIIEYAKDCGIQAAEDLLLLCGPDGFDGTYDEYTALQSELEEARSLTA